MDQGDDARSDSSWLLATCDTRSDSSWLLASCDTRSDSSWLLQGAADSQGHIQHDEDDVHSNASWDLMLDKEHSRVMPNECSIMPQELRVIKKSARLAVVDESVPLTEWIRTGHPGVALHLLRKSPNPTELAAQLDSCGDTPLSWAVYKAKRDDIAWLDLTCELLVLSKAAVQKKSSMKFLPMHDAAWGNAPAGIATVLCAVLPQGVDVSVRSQTPHQVGNYHHTTSRSMFSWPARDSMVQAAEALRNCQIQWLETIAALQLSSLDQEQLRSMSLTDLQISLRVQPPIAELVCCFLTPPRMSAPQWAPVLHSIPESKMPKQRRNNNKLSRSLCMRVYSLQHSSSRMPALPQLKCDEHHVREAGSKESGHYAGLRCARNSRCSFRENMIIADNMGGKYHVSLHASRTMPKAFQRVKEPKWPSKVSFKKERKGDRTEKESLQY